MTLPPPEIHPLDHGASLESEIGEIPWHDLLRPFARGVLLYVDPRLDLLDVARAVRDDQRHAVAQWMQAGSVRRACDDDARTWNAIQPRLRAVVLAPWVLVQPLERPH